MSGYLFLLFLLPIASISAAGHVDVGITGIPGSGFFMQPFHPVHNDSSVQEWPFVMLPGLQSVTATYGAFASEVGIASPELFQPTGNLTGVLHVVDSYVVSATVVQHDLTRLHPRVQVLFHASRDVGSGGGKGVGPTQGRYRADHGFPRAIQICAVVYVQLGAEEIISTCLITGSASDFACVSDIAVPHHWWHPMRNRSVDIFYSAFSASHERRCAAIAETVNGKYAKANEEFADSIRDKRVSVASANLISDLVSYGEIREDQHLLIYVPEVAVSPGSMFHVPVKLQSESDLQIFVIRVKCRNGVRVRGVDLSDTSLWHITADITQKGRGAVVTASVRNDTAYSKKDSIQELFSWLMEVDEDTEAEDRGRLIFSLEYEMTSSRKETYAPVRNKATAFVRYLSDNLYTIVPVVKTAELVNTAMLTGQTLSWPMRIYSLSALGQATDVTLRSSCYSQNEHVIQASVTCDFVYLDGTETQGSSGTGVIVKFGQQSRVISFRVWVPELPLEVDLSDNVLGTISGWRIPTFSPSSRARSSRQAAVDSGKPESTGKGAGNAKDEKPPTVCPGARYQSAIAEVYARFMVSDVQSAYLVHRKAQFRVTHLVRHQLRVADLSVAKLRDGNVVDGVKPGRTEIQVMQNSGRVIGASVLVVSADRVNIQRLDVEVVSGISLSLHSKSLFPGLLAVVVTKTRPMHHKYQEAMLDLTLRTDDGASFPVSLIPDGDYTLAAETLNHNIVTLAPPHLAHTIAITAFTPGSGDLVRVSLAVSDLCPALKTPRPLAVGLGFVDVDFDELTQSDASYYHRQDFDRLDGPFSRDGKSSSGKGGLLVDGPSYDQRRRGKKLRGKFAPTEIPDAKGGNMEVAVPRNEAQKQQLVVEAPRGSASSLELAMYILLAVFSVSVVIFAANCLLFVTRHRRKHKMPEAKEPVAEVRDWVWIGRSTLERNEVDTKCGRRLMSEADFTSNQNRRPPSGVSLLAPPSSGGAASNRNSTVSTYRGSECSVRITANPLADDNGNVLDTAAAAAPRAAEPVLRPEAYTVDNREGNSGMEDDLPGEDVSAKVKNAASRSCGRPVGPTSSAWSTMSREEQLRELEEVVASGSGAEWDYEAFGMTYHELMDYFDNLKESTA